MVMDKAANKDCGACRDERDNEHDGPEADVFLCGADADDEDGGEHAGPDDGFSGADSAVGGHDGWPFI